MQQEKPFRALRILDKNVGWLALKPGPRWESLQRFPYLLAGGEGLVLSPNPILLSGSSGLKQLPPLQIVNTPLRLTFLFLFDKQQCFFLN